MSTIIWNLMISLVYFTICYEYNFWIKLIDGTLQRVHHIQALATFLPAYRLKLFQTRQDLTLEDLSIDKTVEFGGQGHPMYSQTQYLTRTYAQPYHSMDPFIFSGRKVMDMFTEKW